MTPVKSFDAIYSENQDLYPPDGPLITPNKAWKPSYTADYHDPDRVQPGISGDEYKKFLAAYQGLKEEARSYGSEAFKKTGFVFTSVIFQPKPIDMNQLLGRAS